MSMSTEIKLEQKDNFSRACLIIKQFYISAINPRKVEPPMVTVTAPASVVVNDVQFTDNITCDPDCELTETSEFTE